MLKKLDAKNMFVSDLGWLQSRFHFSFAEYRNLDNMNFGVLRVLMILFMEKRDLVYIHIKIWKLLLM